MIQKLKTSPGFTAVELLATLFVAAMFLIAGYQLFNLVIQDGGSTRAEAGAGNVAYDHLRRYASAYASNPCVPKTPLSNKAVTIEGAADAKVNIVITCPQTDAPTINKVEASVTYGVGSEEKTIKQGTFIDASTGASGDLEITNGLIGWWKLNGNAETSIGSLNGTPTSVASTVGQNGQSNSAYSFSGSPSAILIPFTADKRPSGSLTVSGWIKLNSASSTVRQVIASSANGVGWVLMQTASPESSCPGKFAFHMYIDGVWKAPCPSSHTPVAGTWYLLTATYDQATPGTLRFYINGSLAGTTYSIGTNPSYSPTDTSPICIGAEAGSNYCGYSSAYASATIDDVRYYNRALSGSEIQQLYNAGAK